MIQNTRLLILCSCDFLFFSPSFFAVPASVCDYAYDNTLKSYVDRQFLVSRMLHIWPFEILVRFNDGVLVVEWEQVKLVEVSRQVLGLQCTGIPGN